ncbi:MAG: hypothetical protein JNK31_07320, partial [Candidatus Competibacter sp.]|nr:hypothetical protein [Candidatus Competibacter sp.]
GRRREKIAALVPYRQIAAAERPLGLLKDRAACVIHGDSEIGDETLLES